MKRDKTRLKEALMAVNASEWHWRAAAILYSINGIDNALEYVYGLQDRNLLSKSSQPEKNENAKR